MTTHADFLRAHSIAMTSVQIPTRTDGGCDMPAGSFHFVCTFKRAEGASVALEYSMGPGHARKTAFGVRPPVPDAAEVFGCLVGDARLREDHADATDAAEAFGIENVREALHIWEGCAISRGLLRKLVGAAYPQAIETTEED